MKKINLTKEELETMSYDDIAYLILESSGKKTKITDLFKEICDLLELSQEEYEAKIADFFQVLSTDHRFTMLEKGYWDLTSRHEAKIITIEDEDDEIPSEETEETSDEQEETEDLYYDTDDNDDDDNDDLQDLVVVSEDSDEDNDLD